MQLQFLGQIQILTQTTQEYKNAKAISLTLNLIPINSKMY